jgi:tetratricopeptide (TPR) repeat protein
MRIKLNKFFIYTFLLLSTVVLSQEVFAKSDDFFVVTGRLSTDDGNNDDIQVRITKNGIEQQLFTPPKSGRFRFEFEYNNQFDVTFSKDGYYKKTIVVSTHVPQEVLDENSDFPPFQIEVSLVKEIPGVDKSFTNKAAGRVFYNANIDNFDSEVFFSDIQLEEQAETARSQEQELTEEQRAALAQREADYKQSIAEADALMQARKYEESLAKYQNAKGLFPERPYPRDRIAELQDLVNALKIAEQRRREADKEYYAKIEQADNLMAQEAYERAKAAYDEALILKPEDSYSLGQIAKANEMIKQREIDLQYNQAISDAENFFSTGEFDRAKESYQQALLLKPEESAYINAQIQKVDNEVLRLAELARKEQQYNSYMDDGEKALRRERYNEALVAFRQALNNKPDDSLAAGRIGEVENIILQIETKERYDEQIVNADQALRDENLALAKSLYTEALSLIPDQDYPKEKISEIDQQLALQEQFKQLVNQGDQLLAAKNYEQAKQVFEQALQIQEDSSVRERLGEVESQLARIALDNEYADLLKRADASKTNEEYELAKTLYTEALALKDEAYPTQQIEQINDELARIDAERQLEQQFEETLANAESAFAREDYLSALEAFKAALALKTNNQLVKDRISQTEEMILQVQKKQQYDDVMAEAAQAFDRNELEQAKALYQQALEILPNETLPQTQLSIIDQRIKEEQERLAALERERQRNYETAVQRGDSLLNLDDYEPAKAAYQSALSIKPEESYPKEKIAAIEGLIAQLERLTAAYNKAIEEANRLAERENYESAKEKYQEAQQYLPNEEYPKRQIAQIDEILEQIAADKKREADFQAAVQAADSLFVLEEYEASKAKFQAALTIKAGETYPKQKITEIDQILAELERQRIAAEVTRKAYEEAVQRADQKLAQKEYSAARFDYEEALSLLPDETYPKEQIAEIARLVAQEKEQAYQKAIASGDQLFQNETYSESKSAYNDALKVKPEDPYALAQIEKITTRLEQLAQDRLQRLKMEKEYNEKLKDAELLFNNSQFVEAKGKYEQASTIKPDEEYPVAQIAKIDSLLADLQKRKEIDQEYTQLVRQAQNAFNSDLLQNALSLYEEAASLKPEEVLPKKRIPEIKTIIAQREELARLNAEEEAQRQAILKAQQEKYDAALANAQTAFDDQEYIEARGFYVEALNVFADEQFPKDRIEQIDLLIEQQKQAQLEQEQQAIQDSLKRVQELAYERAFADAERLEEEEQFESAVSSFGKAKEILPSKAPIVNARIDQVQEKMRQKQALEANYAAAIKEADKLFNQEEWNDAQVRYEEALTYKPEEAYPKERIQFINDKLGDIENRYAEAIREADQLFGSESWVEAKTKYNRALALKPQEQYPIDQIKEIDFRLAQIQLAEQEANQKDQAYLNAIAKAEEAFVDDQLTMAIAGFENAKTIKPEETYPDKRIDEINALLAKRAQQAETAKQLQEIDQRYQNAIDIADREFRSTNYEEAKVNYQGALDIKPNEKYPTEQLVLIEKLLAEREALAAIPQVQPEEKSVVERVPVVSSSPSDQYDSFISSADESYNQDDYKIAQYFYQKALTERPDESYPKERLSEISDKINQSMNKNELADYDSAIKKADEAFAGKQYNIAKFYYYKALGVKSWEQYPKDQIQEIQRLTNSLLSQIEEKKYQDLIAKADEAFIMKHYAVSRGYYNQSLSVKPEEQYPKIRLNEISDLVKQELANADNEEYQQLIADGDQAMTSGNYSVARFYYQKALGLKPNENYPKDQLNAIKENLSSSDAN